MKPKVICNHTDSMSDQPISIKIQGLEKHQVYTLHSFTRTQPKSLFECVVKYKADRQGCINLEQDCALGGSYEGVEPMGLFWSMESSPANKTPHTRFLKLDVTTPLVVTICVYNVEIENLDELHKMRTDIIWEENKIASIQINRWFMETGTKRILLTVKEHGLHGTLFIPPGKGPFPAVISMFGSNPGTMEFKASLLASHGFVALALAYYGAPGLPKLFLSETDEWVVKLEYFEHAINFLLNSEKVQKSSGVGVIVLSFSGFLGTAMAHFLPLVRCLICINGTTYISHAALTYKDKVYEGPDWFFNEEDPSSTEGVSARFICPFFDTSYGMTAIPPEDSVIRYYERKDVAFMFIASLSDDDTRSEHYVNRSHKLLKLAKHPNFEILRYPGAGHLLEPPYGPHTEKSVVRGLLREPTLLLWGGKMAPHCKAQEDSWKKQILFLRKNLQRSLL
uniref:Bile acid-CoA:amino acid N-acyltransferase n=1 Tax=Phallusia mammillata TaxID=59560 RepID=A0A6F9D802_9ASCI|nr:bile acid-CoA:amino acid N-acyltransferase [Phallusia mammillata]